MSERARSSFIVVKHRLKVTVDVALKAALGLATHKAARFRSAADKESSKDSARIGTPAVAMYIVSLHDYDSQAREQGTKALVEWGHGWVYGWKLHMVCTCAAVWIPLAADLTPANRADNEHAPALIREVPADLRCVLGDRHYRDSELETLCAQQQSTLVTPRNTQAHPYPHTDPGVEVRRLLHKTRSLAMENFNEQFKGIFDGHGQVPTKGLRATRRFARSAVFVYQLTLLYRHPIGAE